MMYHEKFLRKMYAQNNGYGNPGPLNEVAGHWTVRWSAFGMRRLR